MDKRYWSGIALMAVIIAVAYGLILVPRQAQGPVANVFDPTNATYLVNGQTVTLINGSAAMPAAPGSASLIVTTVFGEPVMGDLNGDGVPDAALMLVENSAGSGIFYYAAAAIATGAGAEGTNAIFLGDRIAPQNIAIHNGQIVVNYADRKAGDPMTAQPSVGVSKYLEVGASGVLNVVNQVADPGAPCGGNMTTAPTCVQGYHCSPRPGSHLPFGDVGGTCVIN